MYMSEFCFYLNTRKSFHGWEQPWHFSGAPNSLKGKVFPLSNYESMQNISGGAQRNPTCQTEESSGPADLLGPAMVVIISLNWTKATWDKIEEF